jgi:hypothetical protein
MVTPEIITYIRNQISKGIPGETVKLTLLQSGWQINDINEALQKASDINNNITKDSLPTFSTPIIQNVNNTTSVPTEIKPKIVGKISILYFLLSLINLRSLFLLILLTEVMNNSMTKNFPGALPYSIIKTIPYVGFIAVFSLVPSFIYLFLAFRVRSSSKKVWILCIFLTIFTLFYQFALETATFFVTKQSTDRFSL